MRRSLHRVQIQRPSDVWLPSTALAFLAPPNPSVQQRAKCSRHTVTIERITRPVRALEWTETWYRISAFQALVSSPKAGVGEL